MDNRKTIKAEKLTLGLVNGVLSLITESGTFIRSRNLKLTNVPDDCCYANLDIYIGGNIGISVGKEYKTFKES